MRHIGIVFAGALACASIQGTALAYSADLGAVFRVNPNTGAGKILFGFRRKAQGAEPFSSLTNIGTTLYGTTWAGGLHKQGTVFSVDRISHAEKVLYEFKGGSDGYEPQAGLVKSGHVLYGTTTFGGAGHGTVFSFDPKTGTESVVHAFTGGDGDGPCGELLLVDGVFYGTTSAGGAHGKGTLFSLNPTTGAEAVLYSFSGGSDGANPLGRLTNVSGTLYGTTASGGAESDGTVFGASLATGAETYLYSFQGGADGSAPEHAGMIDVGGLLYGTTTNGGSFNLGTVFTVDPTTGVEAVLYSFGSKPGDGTYPYTDLIEFGDKIYGTTSGGGADDNGTVFSITTSGDEAVVYSLEAVGNPLAGLLAVHGRLYGTAAL